MCWELVVSQLASSTQHFELHALRTLLDARSARIFIRFPGKCSANLHLRSPRISQDFPLIEGPPGLRGQTLASTVAEQSQCRDLNVCVHEGGMEWVTMDVYFFLDTPTVFPRRPDRNIRQHVYNGHLMTGTYQSSWYAGL